MSDEYEKMEFGSGLLHMLSFLESMCLLLTCSFMHEKRKTKGISMNSLLLRIIALASKYVGNQPEITFENPEIARTAQGYYFFKICLLIALVFTFLISVRCLDHFDDKLDIWWITGATITSLLLGVDHYIPTKKDRWMFGSYLEIIAWIPQLKLCLKMSWSTLEKYPIAVYCVPVIFYDIVSVFCWSHDFNRHQLYGNLGYKLIWLKAFMWCGFILKVILKANETENNENEQSEDPIQVVFTVFKPKSDSADQLSNESVEHDCHVLIKHPELVSPN